MQLRQIGIENTPYVCQEILKNCNLLEIIVSLKN